MSTKGQCLPTDIFSFGSYWQKGHGSLCLRKGTVARKKSVGRRLERETRANIHTQTTHRSFRTRISPLIKPRISRKCTDIIPRVLIA